MAYKLPSTLISHVESNEQIGRIAVDGKVDGKGVSLVFMSDEVPKSVKTDTQMHEYIVKRLKEVADKGEV